VKYAVLLHEDEEIWENASGAQRQVYLDRHARFAKVMADTGITKLAGEALESPNAATTLRRRGDDVAITHGPYAETAEQFGGFYLVDAPSLDVVLEAVRVLPEYTIEIRPVVNFD
jgi:hypothetical protein